MWHFSLHIWKILNVLVNSFNNIKKFRSTFLVKFNFSEKATQCLNVLVNEPSAKSVDGLFCCHLNPYTLYKQFIHIIMMSFFSQNKVTRKRCFVCQSPKNSFIWLALSLYSVISDPALLFSHQKDNITGLRRPARFDEIFHIFTWAVSWLSALGIHTLLRLSAKEKNDETNKKERFFFHTQM